uniref:DUF667 domain-containing protein n=1 Tax=Macrostomum lignano TaxID=282301 RepID=A0A1I8I7E6_9PLAT
MTTSNGTAGKDESLIPAASSGATAANSAASSSAASDAEAATKSTGCCGRRLQGGRCRATTCVLAGLLTLLAAGFAVLCLFYFFLDGRTALTAFGANSGDCGRGGSARRRFSPAASSSMLLAAPSDGWRQASASGDAADFADPTGWRLRPDGGLYAAACGRFNAAVSLRWTGRGVERETSAIRQLQLRLRDSLLETLLTPAPGQRPAWQAALANLTRACASSAGLTATQLVSAFSDPTRFTPMSVFGAESVVWGFEHSPERVLAQFLVHDLPAGVDLVSPVPGSAIPADSLPLCLTPAPPAAWRAAFRLAKRGVPYLIVEKMAAYHVALHQLLDGESRAAPEDHLLDAAGLAGLFPNGATGWASFRSLILPAWAEGKYSRVCARQPDRLRRLFDLASRQDPDTLVGYAFVNSLVALRPHFHELLDALPTEVAPAGEHPDRFADGDRPERCLRSLHRLFPDALLATFAARHLSPGAGPLRLAADRTEAARAALLAETGGDPRLAGRPEVPVLGLPTDFGGLGGEERLLNLYGDLRLPADAAFLPGLLDALRHRRLSAHRLAFHAASAAPPLPTPAPPLPPRFFRDALDDQGRRFPYPLAFYLPALLPRPRQLDFLLAYELASRAAAQAPPAALNRSAADCLDAETATVRRDFVEFTAAAAALRMTSPTSPAFPAARREFFVSVSQLYCQKAVPGHRWGRAGPLPDRVGRLLARLPGFADAFNCLGDGRRVCRPGSRGQRLPGLLTCGPRGPTAQFEFPYKLSEDLRALRVGGGRGGPGDRSADEPVFLKQCPDKTCIEMFKDTFQSGFLSVLYSIGSKPLQIWTKQVRNGHIKRITDNDIQSLVLEIVGTNVSTTYITCPAESDKTLGIKLPFLVMIIKNLKKYFTFEVQILDDKNVRRRFRASNYQSTTRFNLSDFTRRAYGTNYIETLRIQIHANCRIRRVYFSDRLYTEDELPAEFKLFLPVGGQKSGDKLPAATQQQAV